MTTPSDKYEPDPPMPAKCSSCGVLFLGKVCPKCRGSIVLDIAPRPECGSSDDTPETDAEAVSKPGPGEWIEMVTTDFAKGLERSRNVWRKQASVNEERRWALEQELAAVRSASGRSAQAVRDFLDVLDKVYPSGHPDILVTTGAATPLRLSDLRALVSTSGLSQQRVNLTGKQIEQIKTFAFGDETDPEEASPVTIGWLPEHEDGPGWYIWLQEYPEEGSLPLEVKAVDVCANCGEVAPPGCEGRFTKDGQSCALVRGAAVPSATGRSE